MAITARSIIEDAVTILQDDTNVRWPVAELCRYFNDGQRAIGTVRPDALVKTAAVALVAGTRQALPADGVKLIEPLRNTAGNKRAVRMVSREILDAQIPGWHNITGVTEIKHVMYDVRDALTFFVYPPAAGAGASIDIVYSCKPTDITVVGAGAATSDVTGNLSLADQFSNPLRDYIVFRAYGKDAEYAANAARADKHLQLFADQLGIELNAARAVAPISSGNPNMVTPRAPTGAG